MSAIQTTYSERAPLGRPGLIGTMTKSDVDTRVCETAAGIGYGAAVGSGTGPKGAVLGGAVTIFLGVAVEDKTAPSDAVTDEYAEDALCGVCFRGDVWVTTKNIVVQGGDVYYDATTGLWDDAASGNVGPVKGARWMTGAASGGLALVRLTGSQSDK